VAQLATLFSASAPSAARGRGSGTRRIVAGRETCSTHHGRTTERFVVQARWVTSDRAFVFALVLQVDSLQLLERLSRQRDSQQGSGASQSVQQRARTWWR